MNRKWKLGVATSFLLAWLAANPAQAQFSSPFKLDSLDGSTGFSVQGINPYDRLGSSSQILNDINGDGIDDILISMNGNDNTGNLNEGKVYVIFGTNTGFTSSFDLSTLDGTNGFVVTGIKSTPYDGPKVVGIDDFNGDGLGDFSIGSNLADTTYLVFGKSTAFSASLDVSALNGTNGFVINSVNIGSSLDSSWGQADINGDGLSDVIIGAPQADVLPLTSAGRTYIIFGTSSAFGASFDLNTLNGTNGFVIYGNMASGKLGSLIGNLSDFNGDGVDDIIITSESDSDLRVVFGNSLGFTDSLNVADLDGTNGFTVNGFAYTGYAYTYPAKGAGDINGDGLGDIIIGSPRNDNNSNKSFVIFGSASPFSATFDINTLSASSGVLIENSVFGQQDLGKPVSGVGDINGDGIDDVFIGSRYTKLNYVLFGKNTSFGDTLSLTTIDGKTGVDFEFVDAFNNSRSVDGGGDINGDGLDDFIFSGTSYNNKNGTAYIVFGDSISDTTAPLVATFKPLNGATNVSKASNLILNFNERIAKGTGNISIYKASDNSVVETIDVNSANVVINIKSLTINPTNQLGDGQDYYVQIDATALQDAWGNAFAGIGDNTTWNFKTVGAGELSSEISISTLDGTNGFTMKSTGTFVDAYTAISNAGDFNGDGLDDFIIGHPYAYVGDSTNGVAYIVFGNVSGFASPLDLTVLDGTNGLEVTGFPVNTQAGYSVSNVGDVNGDTIDDIIIGTNINWQDTTNSYGGKTYVIFGSSAGFSSPFDIASLNGSNGFIISGLDTKTNNPAGQPFNFNVSGGLDLNGDGSDDIIIGADRASTNGLNRTGKIYVVFGLSGGFTSSLDASTLNGTNGFFMDGLNVDDNLGKAVSSAGDINGDGIDDLMVSAYGSGPSGAVYILFGNAAGFGTSFDLSTLDGTNGFVIKGINNGDALGGSVSNAGDVNGDGLDDIIVGSYYGNSGTGSGYVVFGKTTGFSALLDLSALDGTNGFVINGKNNGDYAGFAVSGAGDVNGDGFDDIMVGAPGVDVNGVNYSGESYIVFGKNAAFGASFDPAALDGTNGFVIAGEKEYDYIGFKLSAAGDVNGDGAADVLLSGYYGGTHIVFGVGSQTNAEGIAAKDYNALVDLYNATDGANWTSNANWIVSDTISTWLGVTISGTNVTGISLPNNNLQGNVPASISNITTLKVLNLANNAIASLPNLTSLSNLDTLDVSGNNLDFTSLELNSTIPSIIYTNQQPTMTIPVDTLVYAGQPYVLSASIPGSFNKYQWFKDSVAMTGKTNDTLSIAIVNRSSMGNFYAQITNDSVPGLILSTGINSVLAGADISGIVKDSNGKLLDQGDVSLFKVNLDAAFDTTAIFTLVSGQGGAFNFPKAVLADYLFLATIDTIAFPETLPTYWTNTIFWEEADTLALNTNQSDLEILVSAIPPENPGGEGVIFGTVFEDLPITSGRLAIRRKLPRASVSVRKKRGASKGNGFEEEIFDLVGYVTTNDQGEYSIDGLLPGIYRFNVQYPGIPMDTINSNIDIEVTEMGAGKTNRVIATVTEDGIILETTPLGINQNTYKNWADVYPVPATQELYIKLDQYRKIDVQISILNMTGKTILTKIKQLSPENPDPIVLDIRGLEPGVYIIDIKSSKNIGNKPLRWKTRFIKSE